MLCVVSMPSETKASTRLWLLWRRVSMPLMARSRHTLSVLCSMAMSPRVANCSTLYASQALRTATAAELCTSPPRIVMLPIWISLTVWPQNAHCAIQQWREALSIFPIRLSMPSMETPPQSTAVRTARQIVLSASQAAAPTV